MFRTFEQRLAILIAITLFIGTFIAISNGADPRYVIVMTLLGTVVAVFLIFVSWVARGK